MAQSPRRVSQPIDGRGNAVTNFVEGAISREAIPSDGAWHAFPVEGGVRLHVWPSRKGVLYTTSRAAPAVAGDEVADHVAASLPLPAGGVYLLTFDGPSTLFIAADPDASGADPVVGLMRSPGVA